MNFVRTMAYIYKAAAVILTLMFTAGCSGVNPIEEVIGKEEPVKGSINIWCSKETEDSVKYSAELFRQKNPEVSFKITAVSGQDFDSRMKLREITKEESPDIVEVSTYKIPQLIKDYPDFFVPVSDEIGKIKDQILPWKLKEVTVDKEVYAFPWDSNPKVMLYNKDLADKYGVEPFDIKTWDDFLKLGNNLKEKSKGSIKLLALNEAVDGNLYSSMLRQLRSKSYSITTGVSLPDEESKFALSEIKDLYSQKLIYELSSGEEPLQALKDLSVLCVIADARTINKINNSNEYKAIQWQIESLPAFEPGGKNSANGEGNALMLTKNTEENDAAAKFVRFMLTDKESNIYALKNSDIIPSVTDFYTLPVFNGITDNFKELKVWRFMSEKNREESELIYDEQYSKVIKELLKLEQSAIGGQNIEALIKNFENEFNKVPR